MRRLRTVEVLDPDNSPYWQQQTNKLLTRRSNFAVTVTDDKILIMGGYDGHGVTNVCEMFIDGDADHDGPDGGGGQYPSSEAGAGNRWRHRAYIYCPPVVKMVTSITFLFKCS